MHPIIRRGLYAAIALAALPTWAIAQAPVTVTGRVTSTDGVPLAYADVRIPALSVGGVSRENGVYVFVIPGARVSGQEVELVIRVLGYKTQTVKITLNPGTITQDFTLAPNPLQLGEVVVTGAGTATEVEKLGNVRDHVDSTLIQRSNEQNIVAAIAGKAPNVEVNTQSGEPGASSFIRIRGQKTIQGSGQPLIVVDGVPIDNSTNSTGSFLAGTVAPNRASDINPSDIENIEILKGAAAAAIYGARAAQGVVLITTKSGHAGPTRISFSTTVTTDKVDKGVPLQTMYGQGSGGVAATCAAPGCRPNPASYGPLLPAGTPTFDHFSEMFHTGHMVDNNLTISGGSDRTQFYFGGSWMDQNGTIVGPNNGYRRATARLKASHRLLDNLTVTGNFAYTDARGDYIQKGSNVSGLLLGALRTPPEFDNRYYLDSATGLHRSFRYPEPTANSALASRGYDNPFFVVNKMANTSEVSRAFGGVDLRYLPISWLQVQYTLGADYSADQRLSGFPQSSSNFPQGQVIRADYINYQIDHNLTGTATYTLTPSFSGTVTVGQNLNVRTYQQVYVTGNQLIAPQPFKLSNTVDRDPPSDFESDVHSESYFGQLTADLWNQLFFTVAARNDGYSSFGQNNKRAWFPKASIAWTFTSYLNQDNSVFKFLQRPLSWLNYGKARLAYGQSGRAPNAYQTLSTYGTGSFGDGGWGPSLTPTQAGFGGLYTGGQRPQDNLKPERTGELESGFDLGMFRDRTDAHFTYYRDLSKDVILSVPLPPSTGFTSQAQNAARILNVGYEVSLNVRPVTAARLTWEIGAQWATNDNRVLDLAGAEFVGLPGAFAGAPGAAVKGSRVGVLRGNDFARCGITAGITCTNAPTGALYIDASGFPILDPETRVIMDPTPKWTASVNSSLRFGKWQLSGLLDVRHGGQVWNGTIGALHNFGTSKDTEIRGQTRTFGQDFMPGPVGGPGAGTPVVIDQGWFTGLGNGFGPVASQFIENGGFVKLREISVAYSLDGPWVDRMFGVRSIDLRVAGRNLHTWTKYTGIDPETNLAGAEVGLQGIDYFNNPQTRSFVFSITLNR
jgi:TonB-linked SusC/RagA family outer membrane protein